MDKKKTYAITYVYRFEEEKRLNIELLLDTHTLELVSGQKRILPDWTRLGYHRCSLCPLDDRAYPHCPVAANFSGIMDKFSGFTSLDRVHAACIVDERTYTKDTTVQMGLSPLLGIIMTTSGCPVMEQLKPMVRFHLPFASLEETIFRMVSMYLVAQYLRHRAGKSAEWSLGGLTKIYEQVSAVNADFAERLSGAAKNDVNVNALVNLDAFAKMVPLAADKMLHKIEPYFSALLR
ncbi:MAG TPA: hypothetical protein VK654_13865 [Nitrospirota bacterium]|nr:hypothetical protein [Nitrospirota bacterium]